MVFQLRVVAGTARSFSSLPRWLIAFIWRRYTPKTNRFSIAMIFNNHLSAEGKHSEEWRVTYDETGSGLCSTITKRVTSAREGWRANGFFDASLMMSRAGQIMISHLNGSFLAIALRRVGS